MNKSQKIGLSVAVITAVNAMVGASIFTNPALLVVGVGPVALITYLFVIGIVTCLALSIAYVAQHCKGEGSFYQFASLWSGHIGGLIASFTYIIGLVIALGLLTRVVCNIYLINYVSCISPTVLALLLIGFLILLNSFGAKLSRLGQIILLVLTFVPVAIISLLCFIKTDFANLVPFMPYGLESFRLAIPSVIFGFFGFECTMNLFNVIHNPQKNVSRAIVLSVLLVGALYFLFISGIFLGIPKEAFVHGSETTLSQALLYLYPQYTLLGVFIDWAIIITIMGTLYAMLWSLGEMLRTLYKQWRPHRSISIVTALGAAGVGIFTTYAAVTNLSLYFNLVAFFLTIGYALCIMPIFVKKNFADKKTIAVAVIGVIAAVIICITAVQGMLQ